MGILFLGKTAIRFDPAQQKAAKPPPKQRAPRGGVVREAPVGAAGAAGAARKRGGLVDEMLAPYI